MGRLNLLGGQINLLGGQMPTLTCYLPPWGLLWGVRKFDRNGDHLDPSFENIKAYTILFNLF